MEDKISKHTQNVVLISSLVASGFSFVKIGRFISVDKYERRYALMTTRVDFVPLNVRRRQSFVH